MARQVVSEEYVEGSDAESESNCGFRVPEGYKKVEKLKKFRSNGSDKEIWLLQFPSGLDLGKLPSLPMNSTFDQDGHEFEVAEAPDTEENAHMVLLQPKEDKSSLEVKLQKGRPLKFDRVVTIRSVASMPEINYKRVRVDRENVPQVKGLQEKHFATGYGNEEFTASAAASKVGSRTDEEPSAKRHKKDKHSRSEKKEKKDKKKKHKHTH